MLRYAHFQATVNSRFQGLATSPVEVEDSFDQCAAALLDIDGEASEHDLIQYVGKHRHTSCAFDEFKGAIIDLYLPESRSIFMKAFDQYIDTSKQDTHGITRTLGDELYGSLLHPTSSSFMDADMPSDEQLVRHGEVALKQKVAKKFKQESAFGLETLFSGVESRRSSGGLFVVDVPAENAGAGEIAPETNEEPAAPSPDPIQNVDAQDVDHIPDDETFDIDLFELDSGWDADSIASTEPDEEYFSSDDQIITYRQLRGVDESTLKRKKAMTYETTFGEVINLAEDSDASMPVAKKRKINKKAKGDEA